MLPKQQKLPPGVPHHGQVKFCCVTMAEGQGHAFHYCDCALIQHVLPVINSFTLDITSLHGFIASGKVSFDKGGAWMHDITLFLHGQ